MNSNVNQILAEVHKVIVGKDDVMEKILMTLISRGHVLLDDVPGTGKTTAALAFHRALGLRYGRIQFTPDVLPCWPTRSTVPPARRRQRFWRSWRSGRSRWTA